jgi:hypothetical protein
VTEKGRTRQLDRRPRTAGIGAKLSTASRFAGGSHFSPASSAPEINPQWLLAWLKSWNEVC